MYSVETVTVNGKEYPFYVDENGKNLVCRDMFICGTRVLSEKGPGAIPIKLFYMPWEQKSHTLLVAVENGTLINPERGGITLLPGRKNKSHEDSMKDLLLKLFGKDDVSFETYKITKIEDVK